MRAYLNNTELKIFNTIVYPAPYIKHQTAEFVNFKLNKPSVLKIECDTMPQTVNIRPKRYNIEYSINGNVIEIQINEPCNFSVELNGDITDGLMVFAGCDSKIDMSGFDNVITLKKGRHFADEIHINTDNTLVYFEDGAYVDGKIIAKDCNNLTIAGLGIISMEKYSRMGGRYTAVSLNNCKNANIYDITVLDSSNWSVCISGCDNVNINNIKIIGQRGNSDGIDICGSRNVTVKNSFTRVWDDSLVVKAFNTGDVDNIVFENCVLWNDFARPIEVGVELRAEKVHNVHFKNIDIIHSPTGYPVMGIHHGDRADVYDISFENINIEDAPAAQLMDIHIRDSVWNTDTQKGSIHDILFKDIFFADNLKCALSPSRIEGFSPEITVENVVIDNVRICGMAVQNAKQLNLITNDYVSNIKFKSDNPPYINLVKTHIDTKEDFVLKDGYYEGIVTVTAQNTSNEDVSGKCRLEIKPSYKAKIFDGDFEFNLKANQKLSKDFKAIIPPGKFVIEVQSNNAFVNCDWKYINLDLVLENDIQSATEYEFVNCFGKNFGGIKLALKNDLLILKSELLKTNSFNVFLAKPVPMQKGEVVFSVEQTDWADAPAVINGKNGLELAPQLRCPAEITYVFKNEPKVEIFKKINIPPTLTGESFIALNQFNVTDENKKFWLEIEVETDTDKRYPVCLFSSQQPESICHMFANVKMK